MAPDSPPVSPAPRPDAQFVPHPLRPVAEDLATVALVAWFLAQRGHLPVDPYILAPGVTVTAPLAFYAALAADCVAYPAGPRSDVLGDDLRALQAMPLTPAGPTAPAAHVGHEGVAHSA